MITRYSVDNRSIYPHMVMMISIAEREILPGDRWSGEWFFKTEEFDRAAIVRLGISKGN